MADKDAQIIDLRGERDRLLKVLEEQAASVRLLTDQRQPAPPQPATGPAEKSTHGFFARLLPRRRA
jgi:hypothetical protein